MIAGCDRRDQFVHEPGSFPRGGIDCVIMNRVSRSQLERVAIGSECDREAVMNMSSRELWTALHGMVFGAAFLLAFTGGFMTLWGLRSAWITEEGARRAVRRLVVWTWTMAALAWLTVIVGTYVVYPWYRAKPPAGISAAMLANYPRNLLLSSPRTADWHEFGMEWKEHIAWFAPILATAVAFVVTRLSRPGRGRCRRAPCIADSVWPRVFHCLRRRPVGGVN